ncbi:hypothetical protein D3C87_1927030 [compost metagenome]
MVSPRVAKEVLTMLHTVMWPSMVTWGFERALTSRAVMAASSRPKREWTLAMTKSKRERVSSS